MLRFRVGVLALAGVLLAVPVCGQDEAPGSLSIDPQDLRAAARELADARDELEEIAGGEVLEDDVPSLPSAEGIEALGAWREHRELLDRLQLVPPEEWSERDREAVDGLVAFDLACRAVLSGGADGDHAAADDGDGGADDDVEGRMATLLTLMNGARVIALGDRLALLRGDETSAVEGIALRLDLAERLSLQHGLAEPLIGSAIRQITLRDVHLLVERAETSGETLARLDDLLFRPHLEVPDSAAIVAREGLRMSDPERRPPGVAVPEEGARAFFLAPVARQFVIMARTCRERGCAAVAEALADERARVAEEEDDARQRIVADLVMPNIVDMTRKLERGSELTELARAAVALRFEALEQGAYPATPDRVLEGLAVEAGALDGLRYAIRPDGGVSLSLEADEDLESSPEPRRRLLTELLAWELLPPPEPDQSSPQSPDP